MAIDIKFDLAGNPEPPTIILATRNGNKLGRLEVKSSDIELTDRFNDKSEFGFSLNKYVDGRLTNLWDKVVDFKLVYCKEWDMWFEIKVELDEATETVKTVFCTQLGQAELSQIMLFNVELNTEKDIERDDYKISILYDENDPEASILNRLLEKAPHYSIEHVDFTIAKIQRTFSFDDTSICDAFQEIAEEIGCLFVYNSNSDDNGKIKRTISVYDLQQKCLNLDCGYRGEFTDVCPKCGSTDIKYGYGEDTTIFVTSDELASEGIQLVTDTESVKNCFKLEAGDDLMTATVRNCNPNGTDYIWYFSDSVKDDMPDELVEKIESYDELYKHYYDDYNSEIDAELIDVYNEIVNKYSNYNEDLQIIDTTVVGGNALIKGYSSLMTVFYNTIDLALYLKSGLMPSIEMSETTAKEQADLLVASSLSPVAVANETTVSKSTADASVLSMAKIIVKPTYKVQVKDSELSKDKTTWTGNFIITNYSDEEDTAVSDIISIEINGDDETFIKQKIEKSLNKDNTDDYSITGLFEKEYNEFCAELKKYALNPLISFRDACNSCIDIMIEQGVPDNNTWSDNTEGSEANLYEKLYVPYYNKLLAIEAEIKIRENEVNFISGVYDLDGNLIKDGLQTKIEECINQIQSILNFENYLGKELWIDFCAYRRECKYSNENYVSDGLDNAELFAKANEFIDVAENEIYKSAELQHSISTTLNNLLAIPKFKPLVKYFKTGNWIRVRIDDKIYKLRLLEYTISYKDFSNISVEFSEATKVKNSISDMESILSQASSMASSYDSVQKQAKQGNEALGTIDEWIATGLNTALVQIQNNSSEDIIVNKNGILGRSYNEITDSYSPEQLRITHNILAYTTDNWKTVSSALGKHEYIKWQNNQWVKDIDYGLTSKFVSAGYVTGSQMIGGEIVSSNYKSGESGTYFNLIDGDFEIAGGNIVYDTNDDTLTLRNVTIEWSNTNAPEVTVNDISGLDEYLERLDEIEDQLDGRAQTWYQNTDPSIEWTTDELKTLHIGDLWHYTGETSIVNGVERTNNSEWIWQEEGGVYQWVSIEISDDVFDAIDGKAQIFVSTPVPPYDIGDLWVQGSTGDIKHCIVAKDEGESYSASDWAKSSKYTDDTKAEEAYTLADTSKGIAQNAKDIGDELVNGLGFQETEITGEYIISPVIAGGTLLIGDTTGTYAQITTDGQLICTGADISGDITANSLTLGANVSISSDNISGLEKYAKTVDIPTSIKDLADSNGIIYADDVVISSAVSSDGTTTQTITVGDKEYTSIIDGDFIFTNIGLGTDTDDGSKSYVCISTDGLLTAKNAIVYGTIYATDGMFSGDIVANSLTLGNDVFISTDDISGLSDVATSGEYDDLIGKPSIPSSVADLGFDASSVIYKGDIVQTKKTDESGVEYLETTVPTSSGVITYSTYDANDYIVFGRSKGTNSDNENYICISKEGLLTARNALIYGTIYATDGEFSGDISASTVSGSTISGSDILGCTVKSEDPNTNFGISLDNGNICFTDDEDNVVGNLWYDPTHTSGVNKYLTMSTLNEYRLKIVSCSDMAIDANGTVYIGTTNQGTPEEPIYSNIMIGSGNNNDIHLYGNIYINGELVYSVSGEQSVLEEQGE